MPTICRFLGILIRMFVEDHSPPHFHAIYQDSNVVVNIKTGQVIEGTMPARQLAFIEQWRQQNATAILEAWNKLQRKELPEKLPPLQQ